MFDRYLQISRVVASDHSHILYHYVGLMTSPNLTYDLQDYDNLTSNSHVHLNDHQKKNQLGDPNASADLKYLIDLHVSIMCGIII